MQTRIISGLVGAGVMLLLVLVVNLAGLPSWRFPLARTVGSPSPKPIVIPSPSTGPLVGPSPSSGAIIVPTPTPNQYLSRFRELPIPKPGGSPYALVVGPD